MGRAVRLGTTLALWCAWGLAGDAVVLKLSPMMRGKRPGREWRDCAAQIARETEHRVSVEWTAPGGQPGDRRDKLAPALVYALPLRFRSFEEADYVRARMDEDVRSRLATAGLVALGFEEGGFAYILSTKPVRSPADLSAARVWVPEASTNSTQGGQVPAGIEGVPLKIRDIRAALKRGELDAVVFPPLGAIVLRWHTELRHVLDVPFAYLATPIVVESSVFGTLSAPDRETVRNAVAACLQKVNRKARARHREALDVLHAQSVGFIIPAAEEVNGWEEWAADVVRRLTETGRVERAAVDLLHETRGEYRAAQRKGRLETGKDHVPMKKASVLFMSVLAAILVLPVGTLHAAETAGDGDNASSESGSTAESTNAVKATRQTPIVERFAPATKPRGKEPITRSQGVTRKAVGSSRLKRIARHRAEREVRKRAGGKHRYRILRAYFESDKANRRWDYIIEYEVLP